MSLFSQPVVRATDANNDVLSGAKWYFYATGGTTPASVYTNSALTVAHANPVVADSSGLFAPIYLDPAVQYRAILKTSAGSTIQDIDPVGDGLRTDLSDTGGAALIKFINTGTGAGARTIESIFREQAHLTDFTGADPTGATSSDTAIANWLAQAATKTLTAPAGTFKFTSPKTIAALDNISIYGAGRQRTKFIYTGATTTGDLWTIGDGSTSFTGLSLKGFNIDSTTTMTTGAGLRIRKCQNGNEVEDVSFGHLSTTRRLWDGIRFDTINLVSYEGFEINCQNVAITVNGTASDDTGSDLMLNEGYITGCATGVLCGGGFGGLYLGSVIIFGTTAAGVRVDNSVAARGNREVVLTDCCVLDSCNGYNLHINDAGTGLGGNSVMNCDAFISGAGIFTAAPGDGVYVQTMPSGRLSVGSIRIGGNIRHGIRVDDTSASIIIGPDTFITNNGGYGIFANSSTSGIVCNGALQSNTSGSTNTNVVVPTVASAAALNIPTSGELFNITGTTGVTTVLNGYAGREVTLIFAGILTVTNATGTANSVRLASATNFTSAANSSLTLRHNGVQWFEKARAA